MKAKIEVYKRCLTILDDSGDELLSSFNSTDALLKWNKIHNVCADQISVNDHMLYGWDELYDFVDCKC